MWLGGYSDLCLSAESRHMKIVQDVTALSSTAKSGRVPEIRGLDRLTAVAEHVQRMPGAVIRPLGD